MPASSRVTVDRRDRGEAAPSDKELVKCPAMSPGSIVPLVKERRLQRVLKRIEAGGCCSVSNLAREVRLSPAHLQRLFKQETGVHIRDLLSESRLVNAARLLTTTDMEIKEVAYLAGYQHHSSFVRAFQRRFGRSPKEYRQPAS